MSEKKPPEQKRIVSLLTDFGLMDPFVGEMKAVILSICPEARIIDISHDTEKFDIRMGAFILASAVPYFPAGSTHVAVVDPGVGSERRPIVIRTRKSIFVGPDNGLLIPAARREGSFKAYHLVNRSLMREEISSTFHGRDVFAPAGAHLACGFPVKDCGPEISDYVKPSFAEPIITGDSATCEAFHVDSFGNVVTNLSSAGFSRLRLELGQKVRLSLGRKKITAKYVKTYSDLRANEFGVLVGSHGFLEVACREKSAAKRIQVRRGSAVRVGGV